MSEVRVDSDEQGRLLREFSASDNVLLSPSSMMQYSENWVAVFDRRVVAVSPELAPLIKQLQRDSIPLAKVAIRYIDKEGEAAF
jgi:hypothetical protein